jgi:DGQHR domain-containing protein
MEDRIGFAATLISQGKHRFFSLAMPSEILAKTCYVSSRYDDPVEGFQRTLDKVRAQQIADYIDNGVGTIPTAIILSAQPNSEFEYISKSTTVRFNIIPKSFLILDGQHRVFGFSLAKENVRVPVIIYNGLTRKEESRLFIDINTKQRPVPPELLIDIKALAEIENDLEALLRVIYDNFNSNSESALFGKLSPSEKTINKISRVTFNSAVKPITATFGDKEPEEVYTILNAYLVAFFSGFRRKSLDNRITNPYVFRAIITIFPDVARKVKDKYDDYTIDNFNRSLNSFFDNINANKVNKKLTSSKELVEHFLESLKKDFTL